MTRFVSTSIALFCALAIFASIAFIGCGRPEGNANANANTALTSPTPFNCAGAQPDAILNAVYAAIGNNKTYSIQEWQFNITVSGKNLTIIGWSPDYSNIAKLVGDTAVGCTVDATNFVGKVPDLGANYRIIRACAPGYVPCGDVCIPIGDRCAISADTPAASPYNCTAVGTPGPSPVPTANTNGNGNVKPK